MHVFSRPLQPLHKTAPVLTRHGAGLPVCARTYNRGTFLKKCFPGKAYACKSARGPGFNDDHHFFGLLPEFQGRCRSGFFINLGKDISGNDKIGRSLICIQPGLKDRGILQSWQMTVPGHVSCQICKSSISLHHCQCQKCGPPRQSRPACSPRPCPDIQHGGWNEGRHNAGHFIEHTPYRRISGGHARGKIGRKINLRRRGATPVTLDQLPGIMPQRFALLSFQPCRNGIINRSGAL